MSASRRAIIRVPPPAIFAFVFLVALWLEAAIYRIALSPEVDTPTALEVSGAVLVIIGGAFVVWGVFAFWKAKTTIMPYQRAEQLVIAGPYRYSRNPMYGGLTLMYTGGALVLNAGWPLLLLPVAMLLIYVFVIRGEEAMLAESFGEDYDAYRRRVRRWL